MDVKLVMQNNGASVQMFHLRSQEMIIGRQKGCGVRIPSAQVSRQHCLLSYKDDLLAIEDLASANGTFVNGQRITKRQVLRPGDKLKVGPVTLLVQYQLTAGAVQRLLQEEEEVVAVPLDDVDVVEPEGAEVELILDEDDHAPLVMDDPITLDPVDDPLDALRAIEEKASSQPTPTPPPPRKKPRSKPAPARRSEPAPERLGEAETEMAPPKQRVKLTNVEEPAAALPSSEAEDDEPPPDASQVLGHKNWQLPTGEDIRDILAQIEKGKKKS